MTRLKALELCGFKSFADRTRFEFPQGITVVVGPNGAGKSNVVDAIKWVLGEQSARSLRGHEMTDVIFAGSSGRRPLNAAEVSLFFDNSARLIPSDTDEVQIMRRVYRSGESEYLVNGEPARLRDIRELFSGTGAATEAYSVIEQGRVDALLVASGRDRRAIFEEAAGITRFRTRRSEALRRLDRSEQNRQRLADIVGEVSSRLETVRHQAARARRWQQMNDRLRGLRVATAAKDLAAVNAAVAEGDANLLSARTELDSIETGAAASLARIAELNLHEQQLLPQVTALQTLVSGDKQRAAAAEATIALLHTHRTGIDADVLRAEHDRCAAAARERESIAAVENGHAALHALESETERIAQRLALCLTAAEGSHHDSADAKQQLADHALALESMERAHLRLQSDLDSATGRLGDARRTADAWREKIESAQLHRARLLESSATWEGNLDALSSRLESAVRELETLEIDQLEQNKSLETAWSELTVWKSKLEACRERRTMLQEIVDRQEGLSDASRKLISSNDAAAAVPGLAGVLADLVVATAQWAPLVDLALGVMAQSLVVESFDDVVAWYSRWSSSVTATEILSSGGRIGFVAATAINEPTTFDPGLIQIPNADQPLGAGIIGRLDLLIAGDNPPEIGSSSRRDLMRRLLGRVWVVESLESALTWAHQAPPGTLFITPAGQSCSADGVFEIGTGAGTVGLVARRTELRSLAERCEELLQTVNDAKETIAHLQSRLARLRQDIQQSLSTRQQAAETIASSRAEFNRVCREQLVAADAITAAESGLLDAERRALELANACEESRVTIEEHLQSISRSRAELIQSQQHVESLDRNRTDVIDEVNGLRIEQATCRERLAQHRDAVLVQSNELLIRRDELQAANRQLLDAEKKLTALDLNLLSASSVFAEAMVAAERSTVALADLTDSRTELSMQKQAVATIIANNNAQAARLGESIHAQELEAGESRHQRTRIVERIRDEYGIAIDADPTAELAGEVLDIPADRADVDREIEELRRKLASMTSVNLEALAESEALTERLSKLDAQLTDVTDAKQSIEQLIARIDEESRRLLGETIETVRGHFRELFERLFGGGQADIILDPDMDLLETSVEIVARPPGKEPRNISLLSGGEKTMTCVALLLAIFRSHPSPFCVLDEVDAALDEANVDRFVGVLRDFLSSTQFIVVTHSKKTMATATTLYGVTMEESGVSKRVSVRFESTVAAVLPSAQAA